MRALVHAVTELFWMQTDQGTSAAVETRTREDVTAVLVLTSRTVVDTVTAQEDGQTISVIWYKISGQ